jgi:hypothetical protein
MYVNGFSLLQFPESGVKHHQTTFILLYFGFRCAIFQGITGGMWFRPFPISVTLLN